METFKLLVDVGSLVGNVFATIASAIAIYLFISKRDEISTAFRLLLNWSFQTTLTDLRGKLDRLNEYNANEPSEIMEIRNILHEIAGQIRGNTRLQQAAPDLANRVESLATSKKLSEPHKRSMIAEVREVLKTIQIHSLEGSTGDSK